MTTLVDGIILFELFALHNKSVELIGSWNEWHPIVMQRSKDGVWCVEVALPDGDYEYAFQLISQNSGFMGQQVTVADPTAPQFRAGTDSTNNAIVRVRNGKRVVCTYKWQHDDAPLPPNEQLIIYEMHIGDFRGGPGDVDGEEGEPRAL